jgi:hypothetical protein
VPDGDARGAWERLVAALGGHAAESESQSGAWSAVVTARFAGAFAQAAQNVVALHAFFLKDELVSTASPSFAFSESDAASDLVAVSCIESTPDCQKLLNEHGLSRSDERATFNVQPGVPGGAVVISWKSERAGGGVPTQPAFVSEGRASVLADQMILIGQPTKGGLLLRTFRATDLNAKR